MTTAKTELSKTVFDVSNPDDMVALQGDLVAVLRADKLVYVMTIVREGIRDAWQLCLANRENKQTGRPRWELTQALCDRLVAADANELGARWILTVK